jgi:hypothetical protein
MKHWKWFVVLAALIGLPLLVSRLLKTGEQIIDEADSRYDTVDYLGDEKV